MNIIIVILLAILSLVIYFIPTVVASDRKHSEFWGIFCLNLFLGWTFLGWVIALIWAVSSKK